MFSLTQRLTMARLLLVFSILHLHSPLVGSDDILFIRGDANASGVVDLSDAVKILNVLFLGDRKPDCDDLMDVNDEGAVDISDGVNLLSYLFNGGPAPAAPFPACGLDLTADTLVCTRHDACGSCFGPADVTTALTTSGICLAAGAAPIALGPASVAVVPMDRAQPCGPSAAPGWPIQLAATDGSVDIPGRTFRLRVRGTIDDMPIVVQAFFTTVCSADVAFEGDILLHFAAATSSGALVLSAFESLDIVDGTLSLNATGGSVCDVGASIGGFVQGMVLEQVESFLAQQIPTLNEELAGRVICAAP